MMVCQKHSSTSDGLEPSNHDKSHPTSPEVIHHNLMHGKLLIRTYPVWIWNNLWGKVDTVRIKLPSQQKWKPGHWCRRQPFTQSNHSSKYTSHNWCHSSTCGHYNCSPMLQAPCLFEIREKKKSTPELLTPTSWKCWIKSFAELCKPSVPQSHNVSSFRDS